MRESRRDRLVPVLVTLVVISFLLITFDLRSRGGSIVAPLRAGTAAVMSPVQKVATFVVTPVVTVFDTLTGLVSLRAENADLKARLAAAEARLASVDDSLQRLAVLEKLQKLTLVDQSLVRTNANVFGRTDSFDLSFRIDKGTADGVLEGHPVLDENGYLVGRVVDAFPHFATVVPIQGDREAVTVLAGGQTGLLTPRVGSNTMKLEIFDATQPVVAGQEVVTSSLSISFPPGIPVGEVITSAEPQSRAIATEVRPFADPQRLRVVVVITWPPEPAVAGTSTTSTTTSTTPGPAQGSGG